MAQIAKPSNLVQTLLKTRSELVGLLEMIKLWKSKGIDGSGIIPITLLPLESKLQKSIYDLDEMIKIAIKF